tara:strand:- start:235 stop:825 length:591 start_codon:yes stop_codon:yes gene_type:complete
MVLKLELGHLFIACQIKGQPRINLLVCYNSMIRQGGVVMSKIFYFLFVCNLIFAGFGTSLAIGASSDLANQDSNIDGDNPSNLVSSSTTLNPKDWGIRNGCVSRSRIRHINFIDDEKAIIDMMGKKKILLTMRRECRGIKRDGYITYVKGNQLCARFDRFQVIDSGISCAVGSLEPYIEPIAPEDSSDENEISVQS